MKIAIFSRLTPWFKGTFCLILLAALCVSPARAELVGYWNFDGNTNDSSGNGLNGSLTGSGNNFTTPGISGTAYYTGNASSKVNVSLGGAVTSDSLSLSLWVKGGANWKNYSSFFDGTSYYQMQYTGTGIACYDVPGVPEANFSGAGKDGFHHVVITFDTDSQKNHLYFDGVLVDTNDPWTTSWTPTWLTFGGNFENTIKGNRNNNATIDEAQLYDNVLTADQIAVMYENPDKFVAAEMTFPVVFGNRWSDQQWYTDPTCTGTRHTPQIMDTAAIITSDPLGIGATALTVDVDTLPIGNLLLPKASEKYGATANTMLDEVIITGPGTIHFGGEKLLTIEEGVTGKISAPLAGGFTKMGEGRLDLAGTVSGGMRVAEGTFSPGNGIGSATLSDGDFVQDAGSIFLLEVDSLADSWLSDILDVQNGTATLADGVISVDLLAAMMPDLGTELEFLFADDFSFTGAATETNLSALLTEASQSLWTLGINDHGGQSAMYLSPLDNSTSVPEPATWVMMLLGGVLLGIYTRRKCFC